ncbi:MAG: haloacid dehalogenase-like hydrolase [Myxococcota bacterium]
MGEPAAWFRVEGVLVGRPATVAAAWLAANAQKLEERAVRLGAVALAAPWALGLGDATTGLRLAYAALRGTSDDRLRVLGEEYAHTWLIPNLRPAGVDLVEQARRDGLAIVLVSDHLAEIVAPLAAHLRADAVIANQLERNGGRATGRLVDPVVTRFGGERLRSWADRHGYALDTSRAYGATGDDQVLLSAIGLPCAVHPDRSLRRIARDLDWPVVEGA